MIKISNLNYSYKRGVPLFKDLNLQLPQGTITGLLGKNGEGKTTMLKLLSGSLLPKSGNISVLFNDPSTRSFAVQQEIFLLPEIVQCPSVKVRRYLDMMASFYPTYDKEVEADAMRVFDLNDEMKLGKISQGQQKKVVITVALASRTPLLLMDEPTNSLDIPSKTAFRQLMAKYLNENQTVIISTHQVRDLESLIDRVVLMNNNEIVCNESIYELSQTFHFSQTDKVDGQPLYTEQSPIGNVGMFLREKNSQDFDDDYFSLELFFNGVISNHDLVGKYIKH
ncbi:ATP-binding cassette domain-containing protein [Falsiporphyromonas endometrii]|uniref:ATP-binding cassette domain-containing protein n=1 Tax=Falsiporphyromonas endometrii TaxID=1387297 RepID=A0ABV9K5A4_9PORP